MCRPYPYLLELLNTCTKIKNGSYAMAMQLELTFSPGGVVGVVNSAVNSGLIAPAVRGAHVAAVHARAYTTPCVEPGACFLDRPNYKTTTSPAAFALDRE